MHDSIAAIVSLGVALAGCGGNTLAVGADELADTTGDSDESGTSESGEVVEPCVGVEAIVELPGTTVCAITPAGLILLADENTDEAVLAQLDDSFALDELARFESNGWCGLLEHDASTNRIWLRVTLPGAGVPDQQLYALDELGAVEWTSALEHEGAPMAVSSILARSGDVVLAGSVEAGLILQRLDHEGAVEWTQVGYQGVSPYPDAAALAMDRGTELVGLDVGVGLLGYTGWLDSSTITSFVVDEFGEPLWAELAIADDYGGPEFLLASDGATRVYSSELHQPPTVWFPEGDEPRPPGSTMIHAFDSLGVELWTSTVEWSGLVSLGHTDVAGLGESLVHMVWGFTDDADASGRAHAARHDGAGTLECRSELPGVQLRNVYAWTRLGENQLAIGGRVTAASDESMVVGGIVVLINE